MPSTAVPRLYKTRPITPLFGAECMDIDLNRVDLNEALIGQIKEDLASCRFLLFRRQELSGQRQVDISNALGTVESTFYKHPKSPHPDIFRVSNNEEEGCTRVGRSGWHIDGTFQMRPFMYQSMYFPSVADGGDTNFIPLKELYESFTPNEQQYYNKLWMVTGRRQAPIHPLVYRHPFRDETTMIFHCGAPFVQGWYQDEENLNVEDNHNGANANRVDVSTLIPARVIQNQLTEAIESKLDEIGLRMKWEKGDFILCDNLGLAHYATEGTQECSRVVGLRVLHRTTIVGSAETVPRKADGRKSFVVNNRLF